MTRPGAYWFPAKRKGWGWGPPSDWRGWLVLAVFVAMVALGGGLFVPARHPLLFAGWLALWIGLLLLVCRWKGEPPRWRW